MPQEPQPLKPSNAQAETARKRALLAEIVQRRGNTLLRRGALDSQKKNKHYVWICQHEEQRTQYESLGYHVTTDPEVKSKHRQQDGTHRRGDAILYEIDTEEKEIMDYLNTENAVEARENSENLFINAMERMNVPAFKPEAKHG